MALFQSSCCSLSLRAGCIVVGVIEIIGALTQIAVDNNDLSPSMTDGLVLGIFAAIILIIGAVRRIRFCLWSWIVLNALTVLLLIVALIVYVNAAHNYMQLKDPERAKVLLTHVSVVIVVLVIAIGLLVFSTLVVHSFICELRGDKERQSADGNNGAPRVYNSVPVEVA